MDSKEFIFKDLYALQFNFIHAIEIEYWSNYNKILKKTHTIFKEQHYLCCYNISFLHCLLDNFYKQHLITNEDLQLFKCLLNDLKA